MWTKKAAAEENSLNELSITIELGNASMQDDPEGELGNVLAKLTSEVANAVMSGMADEGMVMDTNGNKIGRWLVQ